MEYSRLIDKTVYNFVNSIIHKSDTDKYVTIGYLNENSYNIIKDSLKEHGELDFAPRCVLKPEAVMHIIKRHGKNGKADQSMSNIEDIAIMPYVYANFDKVEFTGCYSKHYKLADGSPAPHIALSKHLNGTYYIIEAVTDSKVNQSYIVTAYIIKDCN